MNLAVAPYHNRVLLRVLLVGGNIELALLDRREFFGADAFRPNSFEYLTGEHQPSSKMLEESQAIRGSETTLAKPCIEVTVAGSLNVIELFTRKAWLFLPIAASSLGRCVALQELIRGCILESMAYCFLI